MSQSDRPLAADESEVRRQEPVGQMDVRARRPQLGCDQRERLGAVDQDVDRVSGSRRRLADGPGGSRSIKRLLPADPAQPAAVMPSDLIGDCLTEHGFCRTQRLPSATTKTS
jgi:hypothetical protein